MRNFLRVLWPLLFLAALAGNSHGAAGKISVPNAFSYQIPTGWTAITLPGTLYPTAVEGPETSGPGHLKAMISINTDDSPLSLTEWVSKSVARNQTLFAALHAHAGELERFTTATGVPGFRSTVELTARGRPLHYALYFFAGHANMKIAVTCACAATDADHYAPLFEAAMETFSP